jgi:hypothetical protein
MAKILNAKEKKLTQIYAVSVDMLIHLNIYHAYY